MTQYSALQHLTIGPMTDSHPITICRGKLLYICYITQATIFVTFLEMLAARVYKRVCCSIIDYDRNIIRP
jgi:hypothetical protein